MGGCAIQADGRLLAWGDDTYGQLSVPSGTDFVSVDAGEDFFAAQRADGTVVAWGHDHYGSIVGLPTGLPVASIRCGLRSMTLILFARRPALRGLSLRWLLRRRAFGCPVRLRDLALQGRAPPCPDSTDCWSRSHTALAIRTSKFVGLPLLFHVWCWADPSWKSRFGACAKLTNQS
ncbi:MAG: hypothetical protein HOM77_00500 [Planctomycetes bacterium]|nr:hypothetical protein [Planctomycetota bacterium]